MRTFSEDEYHIPFFDEYGYVRKRCPKCGEYFWTQNPDQELCGEATREGCAEYTFIGDPPTSRAYTLREMREAFLSFFERNGHERIKPYPIVARWRDDLYFTNASIIDFQPYVTEGIIPPPANPLVISQPCVRFLDVDNVGPTFGRHLTIFEMGGHHAFNYPDKEVYWKDETVRYHHEFLTEELGVRSEEIIYKEGVWSGGGNAGPDVESVVRGLEVATLVFMKYKVIDDQFVELPIRTVDTGYGIERYTWLSQGSVSCFHAVYGEMLKKIMDMAGVSEPDYKLLAEVSKLSGLINISRERGVERESRWRYIASRVGMAPEDLMEELNPIINVFAVTDHTKCLAFLLAEGVIPSNVREGYITRLMIRRTYRLLDALSIEDSLPDIIDMQISYWSRDFPLLKEMRDEILEILSVEGGKFKQTISRGYNLVRRISRELRAKGYEEIPTSTLIELYDSHGLTPEIVRRMAEGEGVKVNVPENFYSLVAERHIKAPKPVQAASSETEETAGLPETEPLYYKDVYLSSFDAKVLRVLGDGGVVLDRTAFYPEGGGQPADHGYIEFDGKRSRVVNVQKFGRVIVHYLDGPLPGEGSSVHGEIDWERRMSLMRHHTATHLVMGAARRALGEHVWQAGAQKDVDRSRLDISHYRRLTVEEVRRIEELANLAVMRNLKVEAFWMPRERAERMYGFRLYQGGVVPGREIRVVKCGDWDVEACGGTHCRTTGEVGLIKIIRTERIQDGVERIIFSAGLPALRAIHEGESRLMRVSEALGVPLDKVDRAAERLVSEWREMRRDRERLTDLIAGFMVERYLREAEEISGLRLVMRVSDDPVDQLIKVADKLVKSDPRVVAVLFHINRSGRVIVMVGGEAMERGVRADAIAKEAALELGGGGSGRPNFAQGGGSRVENVDKALVRVRDFLKNVLGG